MVRVRVLRIGWALETERGREGRIEQKHVERGGELVDVRMGANGRGNVCEVLTIVATQFPLSLLKVTEGQPMVRADVVRETYATRACDLLTWNAGMGASDEEQLVETKNGETFNGHLEQCDTWMNLHLKEVVCTSRNGDRFWHMPEAFVRGTTIKYVRVPDEMLAKAEEEMTRQEQERSSGAGRGRGRGRGGPGRDGGGRSGGRGQRGGRSRGAKE